MPSIRRPACGSALPAVSRATPGGKAWFTSSLRAARKRSLFRLFQRIDVGRQRFQLFGGELDGHHAGAVVKRVFDLVGVPGLGVRQLAERRGRVGSEEMA